jgi:hypothetical protein
MHHTPQSTVSLYRLALAINPALPLREKSSLGEGANAATILSDGPSRAGEVVA